MTFVNAAVFSGDPTVRKAAVEQPIGIPFWGTMVSRCREVIPTWTSSPKDSRKFQVR